MGTKLALVPVHNEHQAPPAAMHESDAAKFIGITRARFRRLLESGKIPFVYLGQSGKGLRTFLKEDLESIKPNISRWLRARRKNYRKSLATTHEIRIWFPQKGRGLPSDVPGPQYGMEFIYFLKSGSLTKVGRSVNIRARIEELGRMNADRLSAIAIISTPKTYGLERAFHNEFAERRHHGEWFRINKTDIRRSFTRVIRKQVLKHEQQPDATEL